MPGSETPAERSIMKNVIINIAVLLLGIIIGSCKQELPNETKQNQSPTTRMWITSESTLHETVSRQHVYYYGEDPDGYVSGFLIATGSFSTKLQQIPVPDTLTYTWTTRNDTIIALPLYAKRDSFTIIIRAVDNRFPASTLTNGARVKGFPNPYWDKDSSGSYSGGDVLLTGLSAAVDPVGALQLFPVINTPPKVQFAVTGGDNPLTIEPPDTTYTIISLGWVGSDDDGNQTLKSYRIALNDTSDYSNWFEVSSTSAGKKSGEADTMKVTLAVKRADSDAAGASVEAEVFIGSFGNMQYKGRVKNLKLNAENVLFLKVKDIAGDSSATVRLPSSPAKKWYVKKPKSRMLVVADFFNASSRNYVTSFYRDMFSQTSIRNPRGISILNDQLKNFDVFDRSHFPNAAYYNPAFIKTLQLFDVVLWFTDVSPSIEPAQIGLFYYTNTLNTEKNAYGKVIFTTQYQNSPTYSELRAYNDFAPLDSTTTEPQYGYNRLPVKDSTTKINTRMIPLISGYPSLFSDSVTTGGAVLSATGQHTAFFKRLYKRTDSQYLYKLDSARVAFPPYKGQLDVAIIDNQKRFVMFGLPLHLLNGWEHNLPSLFKKIIEGEFGLQ